MEMRLYTPAELGKDGRQWGQAIVVKGDDLVLVDALASLRERFEAKVLRDPDPCGCHLWTGKPREDGYGQIMVVKGITWRAHRVAYLLRHGGLPDGLVLDHLCRVRICTDHLEPVSDEENKRRGLEARRSTHCPANHLRTVENTDRWGAYRICHADRERARRALR